MNFPTSSSDRADAVAAMSRLRGHLDSARVLNTAHRTNAYEGDCFECGAWVGEHEGVIEWLDDVWRIHCGCNAQPAKTFVCSSCTCTLALSQQRGPSVCVDCAGD